MIRNLFILVCLLFTIGFSITGYANNLPAPYNAVWSAQIKQNFVPSSALSVSQCLTSSVAGAPDFTLTGRSQTLNSGILKYNNFTVGSGAQLKFNGNKITVIYANKVTITQALVNHDAARGQRNALIIIANDIEITTSTVDALIYVKSPSTGLASGHYHIQGSTIFGGVTSEGALTTVSNNIHAYQFPRGQLPSSMPQSCTIYTCSAIWASGINKGLTPAPVGIGSNNNDLAPNGDITLDANNADAVNGDVYYFKYKQVDLKSGRKLQFAANLRGKTTVLNVEKLTANENTKVNENWQTNLIVIADTTITFKENSTSYGWFYAPTELELLGDQANNAAKVFGAVRSAKVTEKRRNDHVSYDAARLSVADFSGVCTASRTVPSATFLDKFDVVSYGNNNGDKNFSGNWFDNADDGRADGGFVKVENGNLVIKGFRGANGGVRFITREANLSKFDSAQVRFYYQIKTSNNTNSNTKGMYLFVSKDYRNWHNLMQNNAPGDSQGRIGLGSGEVTVDIPAALFGEKVWFRFSPDGSNDDNTEIVIDYFAIQTVKKPLFFDKFNVNSYSNNDGVEHFSSDWIEHDPGDRFGSNYIRIDNNKLLIVGDRRYISRDVNLSKYHSVVLSFDYEGISKASNPNSVGLYVNARNSSGGWQALTGRIGVGTGRISVNVPASFIHKNSAFRFSPDGNNATHPRFRTQFSVDNFAIEAELKPHLFWDKLNTNRYDNNDGTKDFKNPWQREFRSPDDPNNIRLEGGRLVLQGRHKVVTRELDLSGYASAIVSFDYQFTARQPRGDRGGYIQARHKNGNFYNLRGIMNGAQESIELNLPADYIHANSALRFETPVHNPNSSGFFTRFFVNNVAVDATPLVVDHYRIIHPIDGLTCAEHDIQLLVCTNADCSSTAAAGFSAEIKKTDASNVVTTILNTATENKTATKFKHTVAEAIRFRVNATPAPINGVKCHAGSVSGAQVANCQMTLHDTGLVLTASDFVSAKSGWQEFSVQALRKNNTTQNCESAFSGNKQINMLFQYDTPATPVDNTVALQFTEANSAKQPVDTSAQLAKALSHNTAKVKTLNFDPADAKASFFVNYLDVGQLRLTVSDATPGSILSSDSKTFVVSPAELTLELTDSNNIKLGAAGNQTHFANEPFKLRIQAKNAQNQVVKNYQPIGLQLLPTMTAPQFSDGAQGVSFKYANFGTLAITSSNNNSWANINTQVRSSFNGTGYLYNFAKFNNVGSFTLNVRDNNYFGKRIENKNSDIKDTPVRFIPYYFSVSEQTKGSLQSTGNGYSYIGESIPFNVNPVVELVAKTYTGSTASNYGGFGKTGQTFNFSTATPLARRTYQESSSNSAFGFNGGDLSKGKAIFSEHEDYDGDFLITLESDTFTYTKTVNTVAPFTSNISLTLDKDDLKDGDGIGYCASVSSSCPLTSFESFTTELVKQPTLRYGRLVLDNAIGVESEDLRIPARIEYWSGSTWLAHEDDSHSDFAALTGALTTLSSDLTPLPSFTMTVKDGSGTYTRFSKGSILDQYGLFVGNKRVRAEVRLELNNVPNSLNIDWNNDNIIDSKDKVSAKAIFGSFRGNKRIIYKRER